MQQTRFVKPADAPHEARELAGWCDHCRSDRDVIDEAGIQGYPPDRSDRRCGACHRLLSWLADEPCPRCGCRLVEEALVSRGPHKLELVCVNCHTHIQWLPGAETNNRPAAHRDLVEKFGRGFCELCLTAEDKLPARWTLEGHHVVEYSDGGLPTRENVWILCTGCHQLVRPVRQWVKELGARDQG